MISNALSITVYNCVLRQMNAILSVVDFVRSMEIPYLRCMLFCFLLLFVVDTQFDEDKHPQSIKDVRAFCERYSKESLMKKIDKEKQVRSVCAFSLSLFVNFLKTY